MKFNTQFNETKQEPKTPNVTWKKKMLRDASGKGYSDSHSILQEGR